MSDALDATAVMVDTRSRENRPRVADRLGPLATFGGIVLMIIAMIAYVDRPLARWLHLSRLDQATPLRPFMEVPIVLSVLALPYLLFHVTRLPRGRVHRDLFAVSVIFMTALSVKNLLKLAFGRTWPLDMDPGDADDIFPLGPHRALLTDGSYAFHPFAATKAYTAFPSGSALSVFAVVVPLAAIFPRWRWPIRVAAALTAVALLQTNTHFLSDVVAGVAIGLAVGKFGTRFAGLGGAARTVAGPEQGWHGQEHGGKDTSVRCDTSE